MCILCERVLQVWSSATQRLPPTSPCPPASQDRSVIVLCNLKPRNMRGIKSHGMLMCASNAAHDVVEPLIPPTEAAVGERIYFGEDGADQPEAESPNKVRPDPEP